MLGPEISSSSIHLLWGMPNGMEWVVIAFVALLLFGNRLPGVARSMGQGINEFKRGLKDGTDGGDGDGDDDIPAQKDPKSLPGKKPAEASADDEA